MSVFTELLAGGLAGAVGILATQPLDTIRIRLQSTPNGLGRKPYNGLVDCARSTLREEGVRGLYKGWASPTLTVGVMNAVLFFSYELASKQLRDPSAEDGANLSLAQTFVAGSAAGSASAFITGPTELVKCIAQTNLKNQGTMREEWQIFRGMLHGHGWLGAHGPCRGLGITILRDTPSCGLYFTIYEAITRSLGKSDFVSFVAGGCAGATAWGCIYPMDVIKTRWSTDPPGTYSSLLHCLRTTIREDWRILFNGFAATIARAWPQHAVVFCTYELLKSTLSA
ncbi:Mitochondrial carnitine/acylcarnitine carrier protein [Symbiodinium microadriaticum]|uniref:Mitochondrial carnitine/acylcarnitine carrier protein n=1 Tax=Symbiodinium microadriaticum TaxID=2951 RepID=A0A1Q9F7A4_SYMMI|nr:Mitochondrial carnitine/acylcarnitine carrier protein [Symbiodinium microadriaticum]